MTHYPLDDHPTQAELEALGVTGGGPGNGHRVRKDGEWVTVRAVETGEFRMPRKGEWYLCGSETAAYRACSDYFEFLFCIARLVLMRQVTVWEEV